MLGVRAYLLAVSSLLLAGAGLLSAVRPPGSGPVYAIAALRARLEHDPRSWEGRILLVRGILDGCQHVLCPGHEPYLPPRLLDARSPDTVSPLPVTWTGPDALSVVLYRVPLLGQIAPSPQALHWEAAATYRIRLRVMAGTSCRGGTCYQAEVLDATPEG